MKNELPPLFFSLFEYVPRSKFLKFKKMCVCVWARTSSRKITGTFYVCRRNMNAYAPSLALPMFKSTASTSVIIGYGAM